MTRLALRMACFFACMVALETWGQPKTKDAPKYTPKAEDFRIVDGKLYNIELSYKFSDLTGRVKASLTNGIILQRITKKAIYERRGSDPLISNGNFLGAGANSGPVQVQTGTQEIVGLMAFIKNFPVQPKPLTDSWKDVKALHVGTFEYQGKTVDMYDYGLPNTPENRQTLTNSVATPKP